MPYSKITCTGPCGGNGTYYDYSYNPPQLTTCTSCFGTRLVAGPWVEPKNTGSDNSPTLIDVDEELKEIRGKWILAVSMVVIGIVCLAGLGVYPDHKSNETACFMSIGISALIILLTVRYVPYVARTIQIVAVLVFGIPLVAFVLWCLYRLAIAFANA